MHHIIITILQLLKRPYYLLKRSVVPLNSRICGDTLLINSKIGKYCYIGRGGGNKQLYFRQLLFNSTKRHNWRYGTFLLGTFNIYATLWRIVYKWQDY